MAFRDILKIKELTDFLTALKARVLPYFVGDDDESFTPVSRANPFPVEIVKASSDGSSGEGGGSDPDSAREATQLQVRNAAQALVSDARGMGLRVLHPEACPQTFLPWTGNIGTERGIPVPEGANVGVLTIYQGEIQGGLNNLIYAPTYGVRDAITLRDAQLHTWRLAHAGNIDSLVRVDFWREGAIPAGNPEEA